MKSRALTFWVALLLVFAGVMLFLTATGRFRSRDRQHHAVALDSPADEAPALVDELMGFQLTDQDGGTFDASSLDGKVWVGSVFFSTCPSTCRAQNMQVAKLQEKFGDRGVQFLSITCDPDKDTPEVMKSYARMFRADHKKWHFLTGDYELIEKIGNQKFGITVQRQVHSDRLVLFDAQGNCRGTFRSTNVNQFQDLLAKIEEVLAETAGETAGETRS